MRTWSVASRRDSGRLGFLGLLGQSPDLLDEVEQVLALLPQQRLAEKIADSADVGAQAVVVRSVRAGGSRRHIPIFADSHDEQMTAC